MGELRGYLGRKCIIVWRGAEAGMNVVIRRSSVIVVLRVIGMGAVIGRSSVTVVWSVIGRGTLRESRSCRFPSTISSLKCEV